MRAVHIVPILALAACGRSDSPAQPTIVLGAPLSTAYLYGWDAERGIRLAVDEINAAGGVDVGGTAHLLEVEVMDTRDLEPGVPVDDALKAVERLILHKKVDFLVGGPVRSEAALATMDLVARHDKVSIVSTGVLTPAYHKAIAEEPDKYGTLFRNSSHVVTLGDDLMAVFESIRAAHGLSRTAIVVQDVAHARKAGEYVEKRLTDAGFEVVANQVYPTGATDFAPGLLEAKKAGAELLFIWMDMPESAILLKQWKSLELHSLPIGFMSAGEQPGFHEASDGAAEYLVLDVINGCNAPSEINDWCVRFTEAYREKWGLEPEGYGTSSSYMAVYQLEDAVERAGTLESAAVAKALETGDMVGVYGRMRFDPASHQIIPSTDPAQGAIGSVFQWQDGKRVVIWPPAAAMGTLRLPPWMEAATAP